ncbi:FAD-dependent oxidoreductase [Cellulomonas cellasea]|uniref:oxidoreductase n=1 Tax=Cellulomonas cellasea TaxID=43670 RepID=UPI0025A4B003|nr:FAD-dependent oxidoreductase [Cellulomonas cellasea]MDM8084031.1 FAD-dependent oxidoreductase [Cellulomonas cellasea]
MSDFSRLLEPARWGSLELPNRMFMPPMGTHTTHPDGTISDVGLAYWLARARGGVGLLITESIQTQTVSEIANPSVISISADHQIAPLRDAVAQVHAAGALIAANLTPGMGRVMPVGPDGGPSFSASDNTILADPSQRCRELSLDQIGAILEQFRAAVRRTLDCGFDAIDLRAHTGYLTDQFMSSTWNRRTDEYGGSLENRLRFPTDMMRIVREEAGDDFPLSMRITVRHQFPGGREAEESRQMARILQDAGLDVLLVDAGSYEAVDWSFPSYYMGDGVYLPDAAAVKPDLDIPVAVCGNLTPELGEQALRDGVADFIGFGRMLIADPDLPAKVRAGRASTVRPCIRCNELCIGNVVRGAGVECSVNPQAGHETDRVLLPAPTRRRVTVVGAGPAGLEAARVAASRGHDVDVYERTDAIGGVLEPAATPDFKRELHRMIDWWRGELDELGVRVHLDHEVGPDSPEILEADAVVVGSGSTPVVPGIPGIDAPGVVDVLAFHRGAPVGKRVVVCGGGLSGVDSALELARDGHQVTVVEMAEAIAPTMVVYNRVALLRQLAEQGVRVLTGHVVTAVEPGAVQVKGPDGEERIEADTVITAFGVRSNTTLADALAGRVAELHVVGDAVQPAKVAEAVHMGFQAGMAI